MAKGKKTRYGEITDKQDKQENNVCRMRRGEHRIGQNGMYYAFYYETVNGKRTRKRVMSKTLENLREKMAKHGKDELKGIRSSGKIKSLDEVISEFFELKRGLRDHTLNNYKFLTSHYVNGSFGKKRIGEITNGVLRMFYNSLFDQRHLSVTTIDGLQTVLRQVFEYAVNEHYINTNPAINAITELKRMRNTNEQKHPALTQSEEERFLLYLKENEPQWYPVFAVMAGTGMRVGEISGLRWCDIDLEKNIIFVNHTLVFYKDEKLGKMAFHIDAPKTKSGTRTIPMLADVKEAFLMERSRQQQEKTSCKAKIDGYTGFIFINRFGDAQHQGNLNKAIKRITRDANNEALDKGLILLPKFSCHCLRSTFATRMAEKGVPIRVTMSILGHSDMRTTMMTYTSVDPSWQARELAAMNVDLARGIEDDFHENA